MKLIGHKAKYTDILRYKQYSLLRRAFRTLIPIYDQAMQQPYVIHRYKTFNRVINAINTCRRWTRTQTGNGSVPSLISVIIESVYNVETVVYVC